MSEMDQVVSCQISYLPMQSGDVNQSVLEVIKLIENAGLDYSTGLLSTEIKGPYAKVFTLINEIAKHGISHDRFVMDIRLSNQCGI